MVDENRRLLERLASRGDLDAAARLLRLRVRVGELQPEQVDLAAFAGSRAAQLARSYTLPRVEYPDLIDRSDEPQTPILIAQESANRGGRIGKIGMAVHLFLPHLELMIINQLGSSILDRTFSQLCSKHHQPPISSRARDNCARAELLLEKSQIPSIFWTAEDIAQRDAWLDWLHEAAEQEEDNMSFEALSFFVHALEPNRSLQHCIASYQAFLYWRELANLTARTNESFAEMSRTSVDLETRNQVLQTLIRLLLF